MIPSRAIQVLVVLAVVLGPTWVLAAPQEGSTAPSGDLTNDGVVNNADTLCLRRVFRRLEKEAPVTSHRCEENADCGAGEYCRAGFDNFRLCLPTCLSPAVSLGQVPGVCSDVFVNNENCKGGVQKKSVDLNCDGRLNNVDFQFQVALVTGLSAGVGTPDMDGDGILNFCDQDSDGDGDPDTQDCAPLDPGSYLGAPEVCDGWDNDCDLLVDKSDPDLSLQAEPCALQQGVCSGSLKPITLCISGNWDPCETDDYTWASSEYQEVESRCDGLDNDCDGLVDDQDSDISEICCVGDAGCPDAYLCVDNICRAISEFPCDVESDCPDAFHCDEVSGLCAPDIADGGLCVEDADCADGLHCIAGVCGNPGIDGAPCAVEAACADGFYCDEKAGECSAEAPQGGVCVEDSDCAAPGTCTHGVCAPPGEQGEACVLDGDCDDGLICAAEQGLCAPTGSSSACTSDKGCANGQQCSLGLCVDPVGQGGVCTADSDCAASYHCNEDLGLCAKDSPIGSACLTASDCAVDVQCVDGVCQPAGGVGANCLIDFDCAFGFHCDENKENCVADGGEGDGCSQDADCASSLICIKGACIDAPGLGGGCAAPGDCAQGYFCDLGENLCVSKQPLGGACSPDEICPGGAFCSDGACAQLGVGSCTDDGGCAPGLYCSQEQCAPKGGVGSACASGAGCADELICAEDSCTYGGGSGDLCGGHDQCNDGYSCVLGSCSPLSGYGASCTEPQQCGSAFCGNAFCCDHGDCCGQGSHCPSFYTQQSSCLISAQCQGEAELASCDGYICASIVEEDDSGCVPSVKADDCGKFRDQFCDGAVDQSPPQCPELCESDEDCDPLNTCMNGGCEPLLCVLEGSAGEVVVCGVHLAKEDSSFSSPVAMALAVSFDPQAASLNAVSICESLPAAEESQCTGKGVDYCASTFGEGHGCMEDKGLCGACTEGEPGVLGLVSATGHHLSTCAQEVEGCAPGLFHFLVSGTESLSLNDVVSDNPEGLWNATSVVELLFELKQDGPVYVGAAATPGMDFASSDANLLTASVRHSPNAAPARWVDTGSALAQQEDSGGPLPGITPSTAPDGDLNQDGSLNTGDLQCLVNLWKALDPAAEEALITCTQPADCAEGERCRAGAVAAPVCVPGCLSDEVAIYRALSADCAPFTVDSDCMAGVPFDLVDLDCDDLIGESDYQRMRRLVLGQSASMDYDGDGALDGCDPDSDGDGVDDTLDCSPLGEIVEPQLCNLTAPSAPHIQIVPFEPKSTDDLAAFFQQVSVDPDGDEVGYQYAWHRDGELVDIYGPVVASKYTSFGELWRLEVVASDGQHLSDSATAVVKIGNRLPVIQSLVLQPDNPSREDTLYCEVQVEDPDGDPFTIQRNWLVGGEYLEGAEGPALSAAELMPGQEIRCEVVVSDGFGPDVVEVAPAVVMFNQKPFIGLVRIEPEEMDKLDAPRCLAEPIGDPDGDVLDIVVIWEIQGGEMGTGDLGVPWAGGPDFLFRGAELRCSVYASDGWNDGVVGPVWSDTVVVGNAPPEFTENPEISPAGVVGHNELVTCNPGAFHDADGDQVTLEVIWEFRPQGSETPYTVAYTAPVGDPTIALSNAYDAVPWLLGIPPEYEMRCRVRVTDVYQGQVEAESAPRQVINHAPTAGGLEIDPLDATALHPVSCTLGNYFDLDGDEVEVSYALYRNDTLIYGPSDDPHFAPGLYHRGDRVYCGATVRDFFGAEIEVFSGEIVIQNILPAPPVPAIEPTHPETSSHLFCVTDPAPTEDADGDPLTYITHWLLDGVVQEAVSGEEILSAVYTRRCERWACRIEVQDGVDTKERTSVEVAIAGQYGLSFNGDESHVLVSAGSLGDAMIHVPGFSMSMWVQPNTTTNKSMTLLSKRGVAADELTLRITSTDGLWLSYAPQGVEPLVLEAESVMEDAVWRHIYFAADPQSGVAELYVDGVRVDEGSAPGVQSFLGSTYSFGEVSPILLGRRCTGECDDGNPELPYRGKMDEVHVNLSPVAPVADGFQPPYESEVADRTLFLFTMNEVIGGSLTAEGAVPPVVDRGSGARHGQGVAVDLVLVDREGCVDPVDYPPSPGSIIISPADGSFYPGTSVGCQENLESPSLDPEGYLTTSYLEWYASGVHDPLYDGATEYAPASMGDCAVVECRLRSVDIKGNERVVAQVFHPRDLEVGGLSAPTTTVRAQEAVDEAMAPIIDAQGQEGWSLSFWYRFQDSVLDPAEIILGDDPSTTALDVFASWISFRPEVQKDFHHSEDDVSYYRYRCGLRVEATFRMLSSDTVAHDHFVPAVDVVHPASVTQPCSSGRWYQFVLMRQGLKMWILQSSWSPGEVTPGAQQVAWEGEDTGNNLVLPFVHDPGLVIRGFGTSTLLDELHLTMGLSYATEGGSTALVPHEPGAETRILWTMEPASEESTALLQDRGPFGVLGVKDDPSAGAFDGISDACSP